MGHFLSGFLNRPEYIHAALNHLPLVGLLVALLPLGVGLVTGNRALLLTGLALVALLAITIWPVYSFGEAGYDRVLSMSDETGGAFLKYHSELAHRWSFVFYVTAGVAAAVFALAWKWPKVLKPGAIAALVLGIASVAAGVVIAHAGGEIRHREFRTSPPPASAE